MITELLNRSWNVVVAARIVDEDLAHQLDARVQLIQLPHEHLPARLRRIRILLDRVHQTLEHNRGKTKWVDAWKEQTSTFRSKMVDIVLRLIATLISQNLTIYGKLLVHEQALAIEKVSAKWLHVLETGNISVVITNTPRSEILHPALIAAQTLRIPRLLFYHSIKDVSGKSRIIHHFNAIGTWNVWMNNELIRQNPSTIDPKAVHVTGCAHFDCVGRDDLLLPDDQFRKMIGARSSSRLLFYPACVHHVVPDQGRYLWMIIKAIEEGILPDDLQIIIRTNPMDLSDYFDKQFKGYERVVVHKAGWRIEPAGDWNFQRRDDMILYNSLLHYSSLCVGIPSTVTIECAISCLPVLNLGFDLPDPKPARSMKSFWNAEFYQEAIRHGVASLCESEEDLLEKINTTLVSGKQKPEDYKSFLSSFLGVLPQFAKDEYIKLIGNCTDVQPSKSSRRSD
jgi:hypothetical protein